MPYHLSQWLGALFLGRRLGWPLTGLLLAGVVSLLLVLPLWLSIPASFGLAATFLLLGPEMTKPYVLANTVAFVLGFLVMIPVIYAILLISQHSVGRDAILPALFGSAFVVFALFLGSLASWRDSKRARLLSSALLGASVSLLVGGILSAIFWNAFTT